MSTKEPFILEPQDQSKGRPATFIFLHGFSDDAEGLPMGLAQQFQWYNKLPYLRWLLPNAPHSMEAMTTAWYLPKALPNALKPRVPGHEELEETEPDDEEGILWAVDNLDKIVKAEIDRGVPGDRIVVGGFSQGCAISLIWGLIGKHRNDVAGVAPLSGYFPLTEKIGQLRSQRGLSAEPTKDEEKKKWFYVHGGKDALLNTSYFRHGLEELGKWVDSERDVEQHLYGNMAHATAPAELRDMLHWLEKVVPA